jgi:hypothetical protein
MPVVVATHILTRMQPPKGPQNSPNFDSGPGSMYGCKYSANWPSGLRSCSSGATAAATEVKQPCHDVQLVQR